MNSMRTAGCGRDLHEVTSIAQALDSALGKKYTFICIPLVHPRLKREFFLEFSDGQEPFTRSDVIPPANDWINYIIGKVSRCTDVDSKAESVRKQSEKTLEEELSFAYDAGISAVIVRVSGLNCTNLARIVYSFASSGSEKGIWAEVPLISEKSRARQCRSDCPDNEDAEESTWEWWSRFHSQCGFHGNVGVALELTSELPSVAELRRWYGEPVKCLIIPTDIFLTNTRGYPFLPIMHEAFVKSMMTLDARILLKGDPVHDDERDYPKYITYVWEKAHSRQNPLGDIAKGYEDRLQFPLRPLTNNPEARTYETFEKDRVKYNEYSEAIQYAILEYTKSVEEGDRTLTVMVVGAGSGALVSATLSAASRAERTVKIYAVEKNANAVATLQAKKEKFWHDRVTIVFGDTMTFQIPEKADMMISELLGSFGDNELSPERLDGAQKFLKGGGICIPGSYTSYIGPMQTPKLYNEMKMRTANDNNCLSNFERPYVVLQKNRYVIAEPQPLFTFVHPNHDEPKDNSRYKILTFYAKEDSVLHGFAGYFDAVLYKDVKLSILPDNYSTGMSSWFPVFFPISQPVHLKAGDEIELHFWRVVSQRCVWYEWTIAKPVPLRIHNGNGSSYKIGLA